MKAEKWREKRTRKGRLENPGGVELRAAGVRPKKINKSGGREQRGKRVRARVRPLEGEET